MSNVPWVNTGSETDPCCCDCCLYPWPDPDGVAGGPFYPATDLLDELEISSDPATVPANGTYTRSGWKFVGPYIVDGEWTKHYEIFPSNVGWELRFTTTEYVGDFFVVITFPCLIEFGPPDIIYIELADLFPDILTVSGDTITRVTECTWTGPKTGGGTWTLSYGNPTPYKWHLKSTGPTPTSDDKTSPQSSPDGTYGSITVS